jgi:hypothetical protein
MQYPFYNAAYYLDSVKGRMPLALDVGLFSEEFMDTDMPWPYMELAVKAYPRIAGVPLWAEARVLAGEFPSDAKPYWVIGPRFDRLQKKDGFYLLTGIEGRGLGIKGAMAYVTFIEKGYFVDFIPRIGRGTEMVKGKPKFTDNAVFDFYLTAGKSLGRDGKSGSIGASVDYEDGQFRNASVRYWKKGNSGGLTYNFGSKMPGLTLNYRTLIDTRSERKKMGLPSKKAIREKYHPRSSLGHRGN